MKLAEEAWQVAHARFPGDRKGQLTHQLAMKTSDSQWHKQLSELAADSKSNGSPYWLWPFENYNTFCPYLVGSYEDVAVELSRYIAQGFRTFILDIPQSARGTAAHESGVRPCAADGFEVKRLVAGLGIGAGETEP